MLWFILICFPISVGFLVHDHYFLENQHPIQFWAIFDLGLAVAFFCLTLLARKGKGALGWRYGLVVVYYAYCLVSMTGYYFALYPAYGENPSYILGVVMAAVLFRLPPREFLLLLGGNHLFFSFQAYARDPVWNHAFASLFSGMDAFVVGCLATYFLFTKEWQDFQKGRLLAERNRELASANAQLRRRNEEMNEIMAIAAHDLRSPLMNVKELFHLLLTRSEWQGEPYQRVLTECSRTCGEMLAMIKRLLDAHAAEHRDGPLCFQLVDLKNLLQGSLKKFSAMGQTRSIRFETCFPKGDCRIATDPFVLEQGVDNLLANAVKFAPPGSAVQVVLMETGGLWQIEIIDDGPGVAEEERDKLFEKFHRGCSSAPHASLSAGLGLFIVRKVAENLGGSATFEPRSPNGALFRLTLPCRRLV